MNWIFAIAHLWQAPTLIVHPSLTDAKTWIKTKFMPSLKATTLLRGIVSTQKSRDGESTTFHKGFSGGFWLITGANTAAGLSSHSVRFLLKEEWDKWPSEIEGYGDPDKLADDRQTSYHRGGKAKQFRGSTPTEKKSSRIWQAFQAGDQRHYHVPCPHCHEKQTLDFFPDKENKGGLRFNKAAPYDAKYACRHCGALIEHYEKDWMLENGQWIAEKNEPGLQPSFHINALYSPVTTWDKNAEDFLKAKDDQTKLKVFFNSVLGLPWEEKGDAPDWERLLLQRHDYRMGHIPIGAPVITCAVDVQKDGVFYEVTAWGKNKICYSIDFGYIEGATDDIDSSSWKGLDRIYNHAYPDAFGNRRTIDQLVVDSGYNTHAVYSWVRKRPKARAIKGQRGWWHPAVGTPTKQEINYRGKRISSGIDLWPLGTWMLKSELYGNLRKTWLIETDPVPTGYCFYSKDHDEGYFKQLTAEVLKEQKRSGRTVREWEATGPNHYHDCRVYNMAAAEMLKLSHLTEEEWDELIKARQTAPADLQRELFNPLAAANNEEKSDRGGYVEASDDWLN